ncbi:hypothetical protein DSO57_1007603 [Entomophthora muscae]|uniref:Uncharacterized protein n=1 Tax=Entomophthora muscae TaxID=34485 RepID=A0ACC2RYP2_9FUNG|nr:hypothetical protein DSO57_1007603 [Entomophthora muscae]
MQNQPPQKDVEGNASERIFSEKIHSEAFPDFRKVLPLGEVSEQHPPGHSYQTPIPKDQDQPATLQPLDHRT